MQLASSGVKALGGRQASHFLTPNLGSGSSRSIHIPSFVPRPAGKPTSTTLQSLFRNTRQALSQFVGHLTAPASGRFANVPNVGRSLQTAAHHTKTIQHGFSLHTRIALARPLNAPHLARPPAVPRSVTQIGLGVARNFSTGRPIFQSLADNVPITGRAFWEADWDVKRAEEKAKAKAQKYAAKKEDKKAKKEMLKAKENKVEIASSAVVEEPKEAELDHYFPQAEPEVTTYLLIPLAPTPSNRLPLSMHPSSHSTSTSTHPLLPLSVLSTIHQDHNFHSLRVSTLFAKLDVAHVFDNPSVSTSAYGDPRGLCTILEVKFSGWTEGEVRAILGESGTGWCVLEEIKRDEEVYEREVMDEVLSSMPSTGITTPALVEMDHDPAMSFVLPTLDFSASFSDTSVHRNNWASTPAPAPPPLPTPLSPPHSGLADLEFHNAWVSSMSDSSSDDMMDGFSDIGSDSDGGWGDQLTGLTRRPSSSSSSGSVASLGSIEGYGSGGWMGIGLSSGFAARMQEEYVMPEPREELF